MVTPPAMLPAVATASHDKYRAKGTEPANTADMISPLLAMQNFGQVKAGED